MTCTPPEPVSASTKQSSTPTPLHYNGVCLPELQQQEEPKHCSQCPAEDVTEVTGTRQNTKTAGSALRIKNTLGTMVPLKIFYKESNGAISN